ncbi:MAG: hypothetical protein A2Z34_07060 [Planctomycetes bacterium RBG_16_59_8]|nr:MAG: hypothetical protein A2Z34_07060 [Planctomycetes bacterium RBG_16_59_8]
MTPCRLAVDRVEEETVFVHSFLVVPDAELHFAFARSSGAGGQNVNKVNTKALLRWAVAANRSLPEEIRRRLVERHRKKINAAGELMIDSERHRSQGMNVRDCLEKLRAMIASAAVPPTPRRKTRPGRAAVEKRLKQKGLRSRKKKLRRATNDGDASEL